MVKVCEGRISSYFGIRVDPVTRKQGTRHNGIDIACPEGTQVRTPVDGVVAQSFIDSLNGGGKTIIIRDLKTGDRYGFCHLSSLLVREGDVVSKGSVIALSGNTGKSTGAHLHFSYATGGRWVENRCIGYMFENPIDKLIIR